MTLWRDREYYI